MSHSPFGNTTGGDDTDDTVPLPEELVNDTLDGAGKFADYGEDVLTDIDGIRDEARDSLGDKIQELDEGDPLETIAAVDGSYDSVDGVAVGGGLASAVSAGVGFRHEVRQFPAPPSDQTTVALKGISTMLEMKLLAEASSEMLIYDGSFISALVSANQLLERRKTQPGLSLWSHVDSILTDLYNQDYFYDAIGDTRVAAVPKQTTSTRVLEAEFPGESYEEQYTDQSFFSRILNPGEYYLEHFDQQATNYGADYQFVDEPAADRVEELFDNGFYVCLFRPERWTRAYRLEIPNTSATTGDHKQMLRTFADTLVDPQIVEPYPQWLADSMAKKIAELTDVVQSKAQTQLGDRGHQPEVVNALFRGTRTESL